jgi:hypothetical protein
MQLLKTPFEEGKNPKQFCEREDFLEVKLCVTVTSDISVAKTYTHIHTQFLIPGNQLKDCE